MFTKTMAAAAFTALAFAPLAAGCAVAHSADPTVAHVVGTTSGQVLVTDGIA